MRFCFLIFLVIDYVSGQNRSIPMKFVRANNDFTIHLYEQLTNGTQENIVYSSFSIKTMIALLSIGAGGETEREIKNTLGLSTASNEEIREVFKTLLEELKNIKELKIHTVNKAYLKQGVQVKSEYKKTAANYFHTELESESFKSLKDTAAKINSWVENQTSSKIKNFITEQPLNGAYPFILVSTQFVRGKWKHPFQKRDTYRADFHNSKTEVVKVDMMKLSARLMISRDSKYNFRILMLPYLSEKADFFIFLPNDIDGLPIIEHNGVDMWNRRNFSTKYVEVHLPRFKVQSTINMVHALENMGITKLFSGADLGGITDEKIVVTAVVQKSYIEVDENGTEAPLGHSVDEVDVAQSTKEDAEVFKADHPFVFAAMYDRLGLIVGRVNRL